MRNVPGNGEAFDQFHRAVQRQPHRGQHQDRRERHRGVQVAVIFQQQIAKPTVGGDEFRHHRGGRRKGCRHLQPAEQCRQRVRQLHHAEGAQPARAGGAREFHQFRLDRTKGGDRGDHHRKKAEQKDQQNFRRQSEAEPDDEQRRHRDFRHDLKKHQQRIQQRLHAGAESNAQRDQHAEHGGGQKPQQHRLRGEGGGIEQAAPLRQQPGADHAWGGQDIFRHMRQPHASFPEQQKRHQAPDRSRGAQQMVHPGPLPLG